MKKRLNIFHEIPCLTEKSAKLKGIDLKKNWFKSADKRIMGIYLQKFISYNSKQFQFLDVIPTILGTDQNTSLSFRSSDYIGAIPLRASDTGKQIGDFVVVPRYSGNNRFEEYIDILHLLGNEISPEIMESLPLASGKNFRPPLYLEAIKFISALTNLVKTHWRKFDNRERISREPVGQVNWNKYINSQYKVENRMKFPIRKNILNEFHSEYGEIRFVFDLCKLELLSSNTPQRIKTKIRSELNFIEKKLYSHKPRITNNISIHSSDSPTIINCKLFANNILKFNLQESTAWRVNFSDVFEKFVQFIFTETAKITGGKIFSNYKFHSTTSKSYSWELKHIEPDVIYQKNNLMISVDAKYKSNLYNKYSNSESLKNDHRSDLHQIMAYSSFSKTHFKYSFLCYPSHKLELETINYRNRIYDLNNQIIILGLPLKKEIVNDAKKILSLKISEIEKNCA